jgi:class 3 adenylate cyclase
MRVAATEDLVEARLALGRHADVLGELGPLIADQPYRERLRAQLMLALYRCDRQADALQAYQDARRALVEGLGIEPGERLRELERAILAQDPALAAPAAPSSGGDGAAAFAPAELPTGVVTFLLTDIEGSSGLWEADAGAMAAALELHDELIARTVDAHGGRLLKAKGEGDSTLTVSGAPPKRRPARSKFRGRSSTLSGRAGWTCVHGWRSTPARRMSAWATTSARR